MKSAARNIRDSHQKAFAKIFESLVGCYSHWQVWQDFVVMAAVTISNLVDKAHAEEREKSYREIAGRYQDNELRAFSRMLAEVVLGIEENPDQDFLGELYMKLELGNDSRGQVFTPYDVCTAMARLTNGDQLKDQVERDGWVSVNDCACGAGATLLAFANECLRQGVNYQTRVLFVAQDVDYVVGLMCYLQLSLIGAAGYVVIANTLTDPVTCVDPRGLIPCHGNRVWYTPMYFREEWHFRRMWAQLGRLFSESTKDRQ